MPCAFCGEGDRWIKTCRIKDGSRIRVCNPCWETLSPWLIIVPGDRVVNARCEGCGAYFSPREMAEFSPGDRYNAYSGTCRACANVGAARRPEVPMLVT
jgi:transcription elongation factor Elf1